MAAVTDKPMHMERRFVVIINSLREMVLIKVAVEIRLITIIPKYVVLEMYSTAQASTTTAVAVVTCHMIIRRNHVVRQTCIYTSMALMAITSIVVVVKYIQNAHTFVVVIKSFHELNTHHAVIKSQRTAVLKGGQSGLKLRVITIRHSSAAVERLQRKTVLTPYPAVEISHILTIQKYVVMARLRKGLPAKHIAAVRALMTLPLNCAVCTRLLPGIPVKLISLAVCPNHTTIVTNSAVVEKSPRKHQEIHVATTKSTTIIHIIAATERSSRKHHLTQGAVMEKLTTLLSSYAVMEKLLTFLDRPQVAVVPLLTTIKLKYVATASFIQRLLAARHTAVDTIVCMITINRDAVLVRLSL